MHGRSDGDAAWDTKRAIAVTGETASLGPSWYARNMDQLLSRITIDPEICHGKPCVRGLRYPVEMLLELLSGRMSHEEILTDYPDVEREDLAAVALAARLVQTRRLQPVGP